jgi:hypothetical protein
MSVLCPQGCGKKFTTEHFAQRHAEEAHAPAANFSKRKGWRTPYGFVDMKEPCTYEEACEQSKILSEYFAKMMTEKGQKKE